MKGDLPRRRFRFASALDGIQKRQGPRDLCVDGGQRSGI